MNAKSNKVKCFYCELDLPKDHHLYFKIQQLIDIINGKGDDADDRKRNNKTNNHFVTKKGNKRNKNRGNNTKDFSPSNLAGVKGLKNTGNTCYFNSVLQCLSQTTPLIEYFGLRGYSPAEVGHQEGNATRGLRSFLRAVWSGPEKSRTLNPRGLLDCISRKVKHFRGNNQQDSQEFLRYFLDLINEDERNKIKGSNQTTFIEDIFQGTLSSKVVCHVCKSESTRTEDFLDLSLPIPRSNQKTNRNMKYNNRRNQNFGMTRKQRRAQAQRAKALAEKEAEIEANINALEKEIKEAQAAGLLEIEDDSSENTANMKNGDVENINREIHVGTDVSIENKIVVNIKNKDDIDGESEYENFIFDVESSDDEGNSSEQSSFDGELEDEEITLTADESIRYEEESSDDWLEGLTEEQREQLENKMNNLIRDLLATDNFTEEELQEIQNMKIDSRFNPEKYQGTSVYSCLDAFSEAEVLEGDNGYGCYTCTRIAMEKIDLPIDLLAAHYPDEERIYQQQQGVGEGVVKDYLDYLKDRLDDPMFQMRPKLIRRIATKQFLITKQPKILTIHLNRFLHTNRGTLTKMQDAVSYPEIIDINPFTDKSLDMNRNYRYRLYGINSHSGGLRGGHYIAATKRRHERNSYDSGEWWHYSDERYHKLNENKAMNTQAYLLFYERFSINEINKAIIED
eukprot:TRINITY_DN4159_c0_g1_i3.p1 TRINITY_DN4159_c0_g1~~TRINITY_DN4159_c0_g1_i3.p1  ORF type:complete len:681 (+),score=147.48 TRINITY_DN4159_c0_g1_i3:2108-4150(+)